MYLGGCNIHPLYVANDQNISSLILEKERYQIEIEIVTVQLVGTDCTYTNLSTMGATQDACDIYTVSSQEHADQTASREPVA
jgi:hypothetical protein